MLSRHVMRLFRVCGKTTMQSVMQPLAWQENGVSKTISKTRQDAASSTNCQDESPKSAENRFRVNTFLATTDRACTQTKERYFRHEFSRRDIWKSISLLLAVNF